MNSRKMIRLKNHDYSGNGAYFVTICTKDRQCLFWEDYDLFPEDSPTDQDPSGNGPFDVGANIVRPQTHKKVHLTEYGKYVKEALLEIHKRYPMIYVDTFVIMPNHIHAVIRIDRPVFCEASGRTMCAPTISRVIKGFKEAVTKKSGFPVWQKSFYDHIIRSGKEYREISEYIRRNPEQWTSDEYFVKK
ncbi:MAG: transposase [Ruminococcus sp.]|nr:transposase [Ruminococcus sp.]